MSYAFQDFRHYLAAFERMGLSVGVRWRQPILTKDERKEMRGILFSQMEPPPGWEADFHIWYDTDHIPARLALDGFESVVRYQALEGVPKYLAVYELSDLGVLDTESYDELKRSPSAETTRMLSSVSGFTRYTCRQISDTGPAGRAGDYLAVVAFAVPEADLDQFDDWYETEHSPMLLKADDWLRVRRYEVLTGDGGPWNRLALHQLASAEVMNSPERAAARLGPKREALADRPWFVRSGRWLYHVIARA